MNRRVMIAAALVAVTLGVLAPAASAVQGAHASKSPKPPRTGVWKLHNSQYISKGSAKLVKHAGHLEFVGLHGDLNSSTPFGCGTGRLTVLGTLRVHLLKVSGHQKVWAVGKKFRHKDPGIVPIPVTISLNGATKKANLAMEFATHQKVKPGEFVFSDGGLLGYDHHNGCEVLFGLKRK